MHQQEFEFIVDEVLNACQGALGTKDAEYSRGGDRLHNFYRAAEKRNNHPLEALLGMQVKHRVSIEDICGDIIQEGKYPTDETLMEKIKDDINYNILCYALIHELRERARMKAVGCSVNIAPVPELEDGSCTGCYYYGTPVGSCGSRECGGVIWKQVA